MAGRFEAQVPGPDAPGEPVVYASGKRRVEIVRRSDRLVMRVRDPDAPARAAFTGIPVYPIDAAYRVVAEFARLAAPEDTAVEMSDGDEDVARCLGGRASPCRTRRRASSCRSSPRESHRTAGTVPFRDSHQPRERPTAAAASVWPGGTAARWCSTSTVVPQSPGALTTGHLSIAAAREPARRGRARRRALPRGN